MRVIYFSANYPKLKNQRYAKLLFAVSDIKFSILKERYRDFLKYDLKHDKGYFLEFKDDDNLIFLLFLGQDGHLFSTLRHNTIKNRHIYANSIGHLFEIKVSNDEK